MNCIKIILLVLLLNRCDMADNRLKIINNSNSDIYFFCSCDTTPNNLAFLRNGYYKNSRGDSSHITANEYIKKNSFKNIKKRGRNAWLDFVNNCPNRKIHFYIFSDSTLGRYSDAEIKKRKLFEKHFSYTIKELDEDGWAIKYE